MGCNQSKNMSTKILSLNYSGILNSPFQFYSPQNQQELQQISYLFQKNLYLIQKNYTRQSFKWNIGKIDIYMQKQRYSCLYNPDVGVQLENLMTQIQFKKKWQNIFGKNYPSFKNKFQLSSTQKNEALKFDYMCYKAILDYLYGQNCDIKKQDSHKYKQFMKRYFNLPFLNQKKKIQRIINALNDLEISVCLLMQASQSLINAIKQQNQFQLITNDRISSIIILRKPKFIKIWSQEQVKSHLKEFYQQLIWDGDSLVAIADNIIIISGHLSSKKQKNEKQVKKMLQDLKSLQKKHMNFIVGVDANSQISEKVSQLNINFNYFPLNKQITSTKKRTFLQPQINKANEQIQKSGDFILSTFNILGSSQVQNIEGKSVRLITPNLPTQRHPYDHFALVCEIDLNTSTV